MVAQGSTPKTDLPKEDANNSTLAPIINMQKFRDQTKIPHKVLESIEKGSPLEAMTHLEFRENIKYFRDKVIDVNNRPDKAFKEMEVLMFLKKCSRTIPILNDRKDYLIENSLLRDQAEFDEVMNMIVDTLKRPSVCNTNSFGMYRNNFAELTEQKKLQYGLEHIENIKQDLSAQQIKRPERTTPEDNKTQQKPTVQTEQDTQPTSKLIADFKSPDKIVAGEGVHFKNSSSKADRFAWEIKKDGVIIATLLGRRELENYVFPSEGNYSVTLFSSDGKETVSTTKFVSVKANPEPIVDNTSAIGDQSKQTTLNQPEETKPSSTIQISEPDWYSLLNPEYIATLNPFQRQDLIQQAVKAGKYDPIFFQDPKIIQQTTGIEKLDLIQKRIRKLEALKVQDKPFADPIITSVIVPEIQQPITPPESPNIIPVQKKTYGLPKSNEVETLQDLERLSPLGRRAIWGMLTKTQRQHLIDHPFREDWQKPVDEIFDKIVKKPAKNVKNWADERSGFKGLRTNIKESI
ncbi:PKD domain-containing protein, partial [Candidatus Dojkabacteria bacterium]|nr:PKD domain-containing protein [Candidatus Dojkabacteria bacterium]